MRRRPLAALALVALISAGCGAKPPSETGTGPSRTATDQDKAVKFAECVRENGVAEFPDPDASGELTIDAVANHASLDTDTAAFKQAISACKDLQTPGFTGHKRSAGQQEASLKFAQCIRENGVKDFPDPAPDEPLVDTRRIPSTRGNGGMSILDAAMQTCRGLAEALGVQR